MAVLQAGNHEKMPSVFYVDGSVASSGDGLSWETAWKTITEANTYDLQPGNQVWIKNGVYVEGFYPSRSGHEVVSLQTGVEINQDKIVFPPGTVLSGIDLEANSGQYYVYVYRSWKSNNGVFKITGIDQEQRYVLVDHAGLIDEAGVEGDHGFLSASIGRPIVFRNGADEPQHERVVLDVSSTEINTVAYFSNLNYLIIDGLDLTGSRNYGGYHIISSNHIVITNSRIFDMGTVSHSGAPGILIEGNTTTGPANYNMVINNSIYNTPYEGVYIGKGGGSADENHTHFNHIIGNRIYTDGNAPHARLENAIDFKEYNLGNVAERNFIGPFQLSTTWNGAIDIVKNASNVLVYSNVFDNVTRGVEDDEWDYYYVIGVNDVASNNYVFNNLIFNSELASGPFYGISVKSSSLTESYIAHNTIYNLPYGLLLDNSIENSTTIANNIIHCTNSITNWSNNTLTLSHNLYLHAPGSYPSEPGRQIGDPRFLAPQNGDFRISVNSIAINNGLSSLPHMSLDFDLKQRDGSPDIGAYEFDPLFSKAWTGSASSEWDEGANWSTGQIPDGSSNILIPSNISSYPEISNTPASPAIIGSLNIEAAASLNILSDGYLTVTGDFNNLAGEHGLVIHSTDISTGSVIHMTPNVVATIQRYITGGWPSWDAGWHQISSPVVAQSIGAFTTGGSGNDYDFYGWQESSNTWINYKADSFHTWNEGDDFVTGRGYFVSYEQTQENLAFQGEVNVTDIGYTNLSNNIDQGKGWHLLGNPFASAIKWNNGDWNLSHVSGVAKIWSETGKSYLDIVPNEIIPQAQGFFVQVQAAENQLTIPASSRIHDASSWNKHPVEGRIALRASPLDDSSWQTTSIFQNAEATYSFDFEYDARFLPGYAPHFFSLSDGERLSTNAIPLINNGFSMPLGFFSADPGRFKIVLTENTTGIDLTLIDLLGGQNHDFANNSVYVFDAVPVQDHERFVLKAGALNAYDYSYFDELIIGVVGNTIHMSVAGEGNGIISVYNLTGQLLFEKSVDFSDTVSINMDKPRGWYVLRVIVGNRSLTRKVFY